jgi:predicted nucleic-acid-binding Zn-ribbon protein
MGNFAEGFFDGLEDECPKCGSKNKTAVVAITAFAHLKDGRVWTEEPDCGRENIVVTCDGCGHEFEGD